MNTRQQSIGGNRCGLGETISDRTVLGNNAGSIDLKLWILDDVFFFFFSHREILYLCPALNRRALISRMIDVQIRSSRRLIAHEYCERFRYDCRCQVIKRKWDIKVQYLLFLYICASLWFKNVTFFSREFFLKNDLFDKQTK